MARELGPEAQFVKFLALLQQSGEGRACARALRFFGRARFADVSFGEAFQALADGDAAGGATESWADWVLQVHRHELTPTMRGRFLQLIHTPATAYNLLKDVDTSPAGDDWTHEEREYLRALFRGKLPNYSDSETI